MGASGWDSVESWSLVFLRHGSVKSFPGGGTGGGCLTFGGVPWAGSLGASAELGGGLLMFGGGALGTAGVAVLEAAGAMVSCPSCEMVGGGGSSLETVCDGVGGALCWPSCGMVEDGGGASWCWIVCCSCVNMSCICSTDISAMLPLGSCT